LPSAAPATFGAASARLGQRRRLPTLIDETALLLSTMHVSGGRRGFDIGLAPVDLIRLTNAVTAPIAAP